MEITGSLGPGSDLPQNPSERYHTMTPQTVVDDAHETIVFLKEALDAEIAFSSIGARTR